MGEQTNISWCDATWNPWSGCTHVSPGCDNCYMFAGKERWGKDPKVVTRSAPATFNLPLKKTRDGEFKIPPGSLIFTCSWSDWFHPVADKWRDDAWAMIRERKDCLFLILTKRPERIAGHLPDDWGDGYPNVVLGISAENQEQLEKRYWHLRETPAYMHIISFEPMLGPIDLDTVNPDWMSGTPLWGIVGGESGPNHRVIDADHMARLAYHLATGGALVHLKQDCDPRPGMRGRFTGAVWEFKDRPDWSAK